MEHSTEAAFFLSLGGLVVFFFPLIALVVVANRLSRNARATERIAAALEANAAASKVTLKK